MSPLPPMGLARWRRVEAILDVALELSPEERSVLLDQSCAGDPDLRRLLAPRNIAVVGASERPNAPGRRILETLQKLGFAGSIAPIHPTNETVLGPSTVAGLHLGWTNTTCYGGSYKAPVVAGGVLYTAGPTGDPSPS